MPLVGAGAAGAEAAGAGAALCSRLGASGVTIVLALLTRPLRLTLPLTIGIVTITVA